MFRTGPLSRQLLKREEQPERAVLDGRVSFGDLVFERQLGQFRLGGVAFRVPKHEVEFRIDRAEIDLGAVKTAFGEAFAQCEWRGEGAGPDTSLGETLLQTGIERGGVAQKTNVVVIVDVLRNRQRELAVGA